MQSVVNGFRNVCMAAVVAAFAGCSGGDAVNSLERMGLRGNVRSLDVSAYEAEACGGGPCKRALAGAGWAVYGHGNVFIQSSHPCQRICGDKGR